MPGKAVWAVYVAAQPTLPGIISYSINFSSRIGPNSQSNQVFYSIKSDQRGANTPCKIKRFFAQNHALAHDT